MIAKSSLGTFQYEIEEEMNDAALYNNYGTEDCDNPLF